jgi:integrase
MDTEQQAIIRALEERFAGRRTTRDTYLWAVRDFLEDQQGDLSRDAVRRHLLARKESGEAPASVRSRLFAIRFLHRNILGQELPLKLEDLGITLVEGKTLGLPVSEVLELIHLGRERLKETRVAELCAATIYGLRRSELAALHTEHIDLVAGIVTIRTPWGRSVAYPVPVEAVSYLRSWPDPPPAMSTRALEFRSILETTIGPRPGLGWGALRQTLETGLRQAGLPPMHVREFLRTRGGSLGVFFLNQTSTVIFPRHLFPAAWR